MSDHPPGTVFPDTSLTVFHDLDAYMAIPRVVSLAMSPDGLRLVAAVSGLDGGASGPTGGASGPDNSGALYTTALWEIDPAGVKPATRLTHGAKGEAGPAFTADGDLLFIATRAHGDQTIEKAKPAVWLLPAAGGEARRVAARPNGIGSVRPARRAPTVLVTAATLPSATDEREEQRLRDLRSDRTISAILHSGYPIRYWDHDLGPDAPRLFVGQVGRAPTTLRDLTGSVGAALVETNADLSDDGALVVTDLRVPMDRGAVRTVLEVIDTVDGARARIVDDPEADLSDPVFSPDGTAVAYLRETVATPHSAPRRDLWVARIDGSDPRRLASEWDRRPGAPVWLPDGSAILVVADDDGRAPIFRVPLDGGAPTRLTHDAAAYGGVHVSPHADVVYAIRSAYDAPPEVVRIEMADGRVTTLPGPADRPELPGVLREVETVTEDGHRVRSWLAVPHDAAPHRPAPLVLWIHGGPLGSWNSWSWRWCPWLLVARGYAVLLPDPALSTGYGQEFIERGWGAWGGPPFTDLMAATDAAERLPEIDGTRTAAMGGSFGGYMANWVAGHTDRFAAIVTHASLWALDAFGPTTDVSYYWAREMTEGMAMDNSPHRHVANIRTPMLVIHGDKDYRVPIGEGLRLWYELLSASGLPAADGSTVHRFLYFPNENHWVLTPQHAKLWYQVVLAYLGEHVLGEPARYPDTLG